MAGETFPLDDKRNPGPIPGSRLRALWFLVEKEPTRLVLLAYFWVVATGFARLFGIGAAFKLNVVELSSVSDFLIAGLRDPLMVMVAGGTGWVLYEIWRRSLASKAAHHALVPMAIVMLMLFSKGAGDYRHSIVRGWLSTSKCLAPLLLEVTLGGNDTLSAVRVVVMTSDFIVFANEDRTFVVARGDVKQMQLPQEKAKPCP